MKTFATFKNFIGFGEYVSFDFRVEIRSLLSGRVQKTITVSQKIAEHEFLEDGRLKYDVIVERGFALLRDLVSTLATNGYPSVSEILGRLATLEERELRYDEYITCEFARLCEFVMKLNFSNITYEADR